MEKTDDCDYNSASTASFSPSFSTYSGDRLAEIAERVGGDYYKEKGDEEFEFAILQTDREPSSSSSAGDGGLVFPVFDQNLAVKEDDVSPEAVVTPLKDLFLRERNDQPSPQEQEQTYSSSSDDEDELDTIPSEIYCPWTPERSAAEMSPSGGCRKSKSTGSSSTSSWSRRRSRIRDLLKRSRSDGKQSLKFLNPTSSINNNRDEVPSSSSSPKKNKETVKKKEKVSAHEKFYLRNKAMKEEDKRRSYLPYKQDLVGLFSNINRYGKAFPPF